MVIQNHLKLSFTSHGLPSTSKWKPALGDVGARDSSWCGPLDPKFQNVFLCCFRGDFLRIWFYHVKSSINQHLGEYFRTLFQPPKVNLGIRDSQDWWDFYFDRHIFRGIRFDAIFVAIWFYFFLQHSSKHWSGWCPKKTWDILETVPDTPRNNPEMSWVELI